MRIQSTFQTSNQHRWRFLPFLQAELEHRNALPAQTRCSWDEAPTRKREHGEASGTSSLLPVMAVRSRPSNLEINPRQKKQLNSAASRTKTAQVVEHQETKQNIPTTLKRNRTETKAAAVEQQHRMAQTWRGRSTQPRRRGGGGSGGEQETSKMI